jgi:hypothetical protein
MQHVRLLGRRTGPRVTLGRRDHVEAVLGARIRDGQEAVGERTPAGDVQISVREPFEPRVHRAAAGAE